MKKCPYCGTQIEDGSLFCEVCGKQQPQGKVCTHCGAAINDNDAFCENCGQKVSEGAAPSSSSESLERAQMAHPQQAVVNRQPVTASGGNQPHSTHLIPIIAGVCLVVLLGVGGGWWLNARYGFIDRIEKKFFGTINAGSETFTTYQRSDESTNLEGGSASINIQIDIPAEDCRHREEIVSGIKEIIRNSAIGQELRKPLDGTLQQIVDSYIAGFPAHISDMDDMGEGYLGSYELSIEKKHKNADYISFSVTDGIFANGGPEEYYAVLRLSDGHIMQQVEMIRISTDEVKKLIRAYSESDGFLVDFGRYTFSPSEDGCVLKCSASMGVEEATIPTDAITPYLTDEGMKVFAVSQ